MSAGASSAQQGGIARDEDGAAAEVLDAQAQLGELLAMLQEQRGLLGRQLDRLGDQQLLDVQRALANAVLELLEQDALVQGVLVDDQHAVGRLEDEVGVVKLDRLDALRASTGLAVAALRRRRRFRAPSPGIAALIPGLGGSS